MGGCSRLGVLRNRFPVGLHCVVSDLSPGERYQAVLASVLCSECEGTDDSFEPLPALDLEMYNEMGAICSHCLKSLTACVAYAGCSLFFNSLSIEMNSYSKQHEQVITDVKQDLVDLVTEA